MGAGPASAAAGSSVLTTFTKLVRSRWRNARVYLFGSRTRGTARSDSDYDIVIVTSAFVGQRLIDRPVSLYPLWWEAGGHGISLDLHCLTPDEFRQEIRGGMGYLGQARQRGELLPMRAGDG